MTRFDQFLERGKAVLTEKEYAKFSTGLAHYHRHINSARPTQLSDAFTFEETPEDEDYWSNMDEKIGDITEEPPAPPHPCAKGLDFGCQEDDVNKLLERLDKRYVHSEVKKATPKKKS